MNIDMMRNIDYWVGVPLCAFVTALDRGLSLIWRPRPTEKVKKVLFIELSEMGSAILVDPTMRRLQQEGIELYFLIFKKNQASLRLLGTVAEKNVFTLRESNLLDLIVDSVRFILWCREVKIDATIDLELFSRVTSLLTWASFAKTKVGYHKYHQEGLYRGDILTHKVPYNPQIHIGQNFMNLAESLLAPLGQDGFLKRQVSEQELVMTKKEINLAQKKKVAQIVEAHLKTQFPSGGEKLPIFLVNANAGDFLPQRKWPEGYFVELIQLIIRTYPGAFVLLTGSPAESVTNEAIVQKVNHPNCQNFAGGVSFEDLPVLYSLSQLLVTNDSGPGHFSSITPIRSYVFFGPETPALYRSLGNSHAFYANYSCSPCVSATNHRKTLCSDNKCLQSITPQAVLTKIKSEFPIGTLLNSSASTN